MSKIVELNAEEVMEVTGGKGIVAWLEDIFGQDDPGMTGDVRCLCTAG